MESMPTIYPRCEAIKSYGLLAFRVILPPFPDFDAELFYGNLRQALSGYLQADYCPRGLMNLKSRQFFLSYPTEIIRRDEYILQPAFMHRNIIA
jgi:hypothetical protein